MSEFVTYRRSHMRVLYGVLMGAMLALAVMTTAAVVNTTEADTATVQRDEAVGQAKTLGENVVRDVCRTTDPDVQQQFGALCAAARTVVDQPMPEKVDTDALAALVTSRVLASLPVPRDGQDGKDGADGQTPPCMALPMQCMGATGSPGQDGKDGADGQTPPCMNEPAQCRGANGRDGAQGPPAPTNPCQWEPYLFLDGRSGYRCLVPQ